MHDDFFFPKIISCTFWKLQLLFLCNSGCDAALLIRDRNIFCSRMRLVCTHREVSQKRELAYIIKLKGKTFRPSLIDNDFEYFHNMAGKPTTINEDAFMHLLLYQFVAKLHRFLHLNLKGIRKAPSISYIRSHLLIFNYR